MDWHQLKQWLSGMSGLDMDSLHVHAGVLCQVGVALVLRKRLASGWPWLAVAAVVLANEAYDFTYEVWPNRWDQFGESVRDTWNTLLLPTALLLLARYAPGLFHTQEEVESAGDAGEAGGEAE
jgi:hypothetical protein